MKVTLYYHFCVNPTAINIPFRKYTVTLFNFAPFGARGGTWLNGYSQTAQNLPPAGVDANQDASADCGDFGA